jgi:hypothetical protein
MAKFVIDDQFGSVDVVVFSDLYQKVAKWLDNGVPVLITAAVKDTGGVPAGKSASLASAQAQSEQLHDEYGGHPEMELNISSRAVFGDDDDAAPADDDAAPAETVNGGAELPKSAVYHEPAITPELNALELVPLEGIRERKVREIALDLPYPKATDDAVRRIREIVESYPGEIPVIVSLSDVPQDLAMAIGAPSDASRLRVRVNQHFRVQPGPALAAALEQIGVGMSYTF